ncbi:MAG: ATP-binding protein, partial [Verrucomicrobiaceae bacterium]
VELVFPSAVDTGDSDSGTAITGSGSGSGGINSDELAGDRFYWDQVFFNLIENALKENLADGRLVITVSLTRTPQEAVIRIRDNGVGIPRADLPFIFKRFYRVAKHHSQQIKGTGLGLSIVRRAIEAHGGSIGVESTLGVETIFTIRLPEPELDAEGAAG